MENLTLWGNFGKGLKTLYSLHYMMLLVLLKYGDVTNVLYVFKVGDDLV